MNQEIINTTEYLISNHLWKAIIAFIISYVLIALIKYFANLIFEFILIKTDIIGKGSEVYYNNKKAKILHFGLRRTTILLLEENEVIIFRTSNWKKFELISPNIKCNHTKKDN